MKTLKEALLRFLEAKGWYKRKCEARGCGKFSEIEFCILGHVFGLCCDHADAALDLIESTGHWLQRTIEEVRKETLINQGAKR